MLPGEKPGSKPRRMEPEGEPFPLAEPLTQVVRTLGSLRLTVSLFAFSIGLVLFGTLAQARMDISIVLDDYFRAWIAQIQIKSLLPPGFFPGFKNPQGAFYERSFVYPGGALIGTALAVNLVAAYSLRLKSYANPQRMKSGLAMLAFGGLVTYLVIASGSNKDGVQVADWLESRHPSYRILWQLTKGIIAGAPLLAGCMLLFKKRAGVLLIHIGIALVMFSELMVTKTAVESQISMAEGETVDWARDIRFVELAFVDHSPKDHDNVVVIPGSRLVGKHAPPSDQAIEDKLLPVDVEVVKYLPNSNPRLLKPGEKSPATAGMGLRWTVDEVDASTGADMDSSVDLPAAYVKLTEKGSDKDLGTYLVGPLLAQQGAVEQVTVGDKTYELALRFKRNYKQYSMHLIDVSKDDYPGTSVPRNYSSDVRLVDEKRDTDRMVKIWMNNPLRYGGESFYQSNYFMDPRTGQETTTLQVVTNTGWMIPYVACVFVGMGMLFHFTLTLTRFLKRQLAEGSKEPQQGWLIPGIVTTLFILYIAYAARTPSAKEGEMDLYGFGKIPVQYEGRLQPLDTLARNSLLKLSDKETFKDVGGERQPAIRWMADLLADPPSAFKHRVVRIENLELLEQLDLEERPGSFSYGFDEFADKLGMLSEQARQARQADPDSLTAYQRKVLELENKIGVVDLLLQSFAQPRIRPDHVQEDLMQAFRRQEALKSRNPPRIIPPVNEEDEWSTYTWGWMRWLMQSQMPDQTPDPAAGKLTEILVAYQEGDATAFNNRVNEYHEYWDENLASVAAEGRTDFEAYFNNFSPFFYLFILYLVAFVLTALSWLTSSLGWRPALNQAAFWLLMLTFTAQSWALVARMLISGRPPVTNLYGSTVFIGWACLGLALILERLFKLSLGNAAAAIIGFVTLRIAAYLATGGDTMAVLQAVLDTQFWLATHVVCITLGYATTFLAGALGAFYVLGGVFTPALQSSVRKPLVKMIYGTLCFAIFFSFVGTVLGGLWADDSWGRFWGWDPKENGALIIVLWNALVLHARWGGIVKERGLAVLVVAGNIATSWSWFGVNELGVGLHSYGFTEGVLMWLGIFAMSQLAIIAVGSLPKMLWWSFRQQPPAMKA
jgi:ABC-type transport system involved in cytochrome c biogenesis permease subunit